ncbi:RNA chaperone Hfq [Oecophyllibacter saccharovorans]|uniref:RNA chaperone Hfq n=1 Tax=Oecophyllibacter saccharovorans TaxID=2558360 RepID=A0A506ULU2_9PROT|nr:RNA chaperone Hfq [Oecophyllibacter saccharovorans]QDH15369.1 RNA chaperone Hfq [Oecophyllibacter saccharovorans]TPW34202.1 RNA chaperone Hfq [Oecophyllibacter saccharovorans]TPW36387.1 RNA chaperone Hfq [Oecophyllibacter saccharovorans]
MTSTRTASLSVPPCNSVQEAFLRHLQAAAESVTVFLVNGVKLQGIISQFDAHTLLLRREGHVQLVYKNAISTIMPVAALPSEFDTGLSEDPAAGDF